MLRLPALPPLSSVVWHGGCGVASRRLGHRQRRQAQSRVWWAAASAAVALPLVLLLLLLLLHVLL
jgi:hypothetical protein